ncbi:unnamed protein product [Didymodactylos carnosus]|uniref:Spermatogenesis-associated protein 6 N-terminal domain-containing protein n=1 Tax=Didymodactylos carnosus TaxID=1234261 RepID=A0A8S2H131_9BILA|nr:unnamed protein product [Didymodactylos carnosus]CAF3586253.1 unnamed protein product [Didymodactylos carnosus]
MAGSRTFKCSVELTAHTIFKHCVDPSEIVQRLEREHILIELVQISVNSSYDTVVLASFETSAKEFLYPNSYARPQYHGLKRYVLLSRTIDFPGISPSFEFCTTTSITEITGIEQNTLKSNNTFTKRSKSPNFAQSANFNRSRPLSTSKRFMNSSVTDPTISSAVKNDYGNREIQEKLNELAIQGEVKHIVPLDKTNGRPPFVVRHVENRLIGRQPKSHIVLNDGLVVNDFTYAQSRPESALSYSYNENNERRSRSVSPVTGRHVSFSRHTSFPVRSRSSSYSRPKTSQSLDFDDRRLSHSRTRHSRQQQKRSRSRSSSPIKQHYNDNDNTTLYNSTNYRSNDFDHDYYNDGSYSRSISPTLLKSSFRNRYGYSPATDLSDRVISTLRRNLDSYSSQPRHRYYSAYRYHNNHMDDDELIERSRRLTQY